MKKPPLLFGLVGLVLGFAGCAYVSWNLEVGRPENATKLFSAWTLFAIATAIGFYIDHYRRSHR